MVKFCSNDYPKIQNEQYKEHFEKYPFPLSTFQKYAIESIVEGNHVLITAHTGSGKTLPAEFAIEHFVGLGKKVIYTAPIKALSNQKFYEFTQKYPHISFGILTGDIKTNPEADVLIMTTEILLNTLYSKKSQGISGQMDFNIDLDCELGCVIFDEVHYINDPDRGRIWEESIMMLPLHIQLVMLSATIDAPEKFALWCETRPAATGIVVPQKTVYLASTNHRVVPLTHYSFITTTNGIFKAIKDKDMEKQIKDLTNKPFVIQSATGEFNEPHYYKMRKMLDLFENKRIFVKRAHVLNQVCKYMTENNMLPALCFVLSRKQLEICAKEVTSVLLEDDSKVGYIVRRECEQIIRKLPNYQEYLQLPEYMEMVALLEKGIAIHHSGVMPVLKEMVELLYAKGYIKLLFATETFSIGVNMPTKTVIFTDANKFDGTQMRNLYSHEYTQMAGRAGRRGIDTVGHVIHLNNLFKGIDCTGYKMMMQGKPQKLVSKFRVSYNLLLNLISMGDTNFTDYVKRSMIQEDLTAEMGVIYNKISNITDGSSIGELRTPREAVDEYIALTQSVKLAVNKKRKEMERRIASLLETHRYMEIDKNKVEKHLVSQLEHDNLQRDMQFLEDYLSNNVMNVIDLLIEEGFISKEKEIGDGNIELTFKGKTATQLREVHCLVFANLFEQKKLDNMTAKQMIGLFSCFTNVTVSDDIKFHMPQSYDKTVQSACMESKEMYNNYLTMEETRSINTGADYNIHFDLIDFAMRWCDCQDAPACKMLLQDLEREKGVFLGEFVKALLKINNIAGEMEKIAEANGNIDFLSKLREIPVMTLKYVATNQSLYV